MREVETDYLVVGSGASGMVFADTHADTEVVLVDRRHRPGGHWLDAYPFVRLHQPSAYYGVDSRPLGNDRIESRRPLQRSSQIRRPLPPARATRCHKRSSLAAR